MTPSAYEHFRPTAADYPDGIYRVVGARDGSVTLLRVGDADGRRVNSGELVTVDSDKFDGFARAENPDGNRPLGTAAASRAKMLYWSVRTFVGQLAAHPIPAAAGVALVAIGLFGDRIAGVPDAALGALILVGSLGLAYVGSGRL